MLLGWEEGLVYEVSGDGSQLEHVLKKLFGFVVNELGPDGA